MTKKELRQSQESALVFTSTEHVILRPAAGTDVEAIIAWDEDAKKTSTGEGYTPVQRESKKRDLQRMIEDEFYRVQVIERNGESLGMVIDELVPPACKFDHAELVNMGENDVTPDMLLELAQDRLPDMHRVHIDSIALNPEVRGKGFGKELFGQLADDYEKSGIDVVTFDTGTDNVPVQRLAQHFGFVTFRVKEEQENGNGYAGERILAVKSIGVARKLELQAQAAKQAENDMMALHAQRGQLENI